MSIISKSRDCEFEQQKKSKNFEAPFRGKAGLKERTVLGEREALPLRGGRLGCPRGSAWSTET